MAEPEVRISIQPEESQDVEMVGDGAEAEDAGGADAPAGDEDDTVQETLRNHASHSSSTCIPPYPTYPPSAPHSS